jgi:signal transduction histidine kinase
VRSPVEAIRGRSVPASGRALLNVSVAGPVLEYEEEMSQQNAEPPSQPRREQTDESLRIEREKSDAAAGEKRREIEARADAVVQIARDRADEVLQAARDDADREQPSSVTDPVSERERGLADVILARERAKADAVLERERIQRRECFEIFLANEREATDSNLMDERADADTNVATRDDFLATVSHDLRSLLSGLSLSAQLLLEKAPTGAAGDLTRKCAGTSQRLVARMSRLVNDLLDVTSIEAGKVALLIEETDVADVLRDTLEAFEPLAAAKGVSLSAEAEPPPCVGRFDSGRVLEVLANLVSNALKFTSSGGRVSIRVAREGNELHFAVNDTGIGIPEDALQGVFEKFKQVAKDRRGLGLGLYISKGIVEAHGGRMWGESRLGAGSTFHFAIPRSLPSH